MDTKDKWFAASTIAVILGSLLGFILILGMVWADFEGSLFLPSLIGEKYVVKNLNCPALMTRNETRHISLTLSNSRENEQSRFVEGMISEGDIRQTRVIKQEVTIAPGAKEEVTWEIYPEDAAYDKVVFFHVYVKRAYSAPSLEGTCGVLVLDIPFLSGIQVMGIVLGLIFFLILGGNSILLFQYQKDLMGPRRRYMWRAMFAMSILTVLGIWTSIMGYWEFGFFFWFSSFAILVYLAARTMVNMVFGSQNT